MSFVKLDVPGPWQSAYHSLSIGGGADITYNFSIIVDGAPLGGIGSVEGLQRTINVKALKEGGRNHAPRQLFDGGEWGSVTLKGGSLNQPYLINWINQVNESLSSIDNVAGQAASMMADPLAGGAQIAKLGINKATGGKPSFRREVLIIHLTRTYLPIRVYHLHRAFPKSWKAPSLDSGSSVAYNEELELVFETMIPYVIPLPPTY